MSLPIPESIDIEGDSVATIWPAWRVNWGHYYIASEMDTKKAATQISILLTILGTNSQKIYNNMNFGDTKEVTIVMVLDTFKKHIEPRINIIYERCVFNRRYQEEHETFEKFATDVKSLSKRCKFQGITEDEIIRDRLINGMKSESLRKTMMLKEKLTSDELIKMCKTEDMTVNQCRRLANNSENVNQMKVKYQGKQSTKIRDQDKTHYERNDKVLKKCRYCGKEHAWDKNKCPAYGKICSNCGKKNHYKIMCKADKNEKSISSIFKVADGNMELNIAKEDTVTLRTTWGNLKLQIDNGASDNMLPLDKYVQLTKDTNSRHIKNSATKQITVFGNKKWPVLGEVITRVWRFKRSCLVRLLILQGIEQQFHPILGKFASIELKLIKLLDNDEINNTSILSMKPSEITTEYKEVFQDTIGRLEGYQVIKIKDGAIAKKHAQRTIAVPLREGVKK